MSLLLKPHPGLAYPKPIKLAHIGYVTLTLHTVLNEVLVFIW